MRTIIRIDETKCTGCGKCVPDCPEGAIRVIDGKARLVCDALCDGLGACIGTCPEGAIAVEEREAAPYDERQAMEGVVKGGANVIRAHLDHLRHHGQDRYLATALAFLSERGIPVPAEAPAPETHGGCPGSRIADRRSARTPAPAGEKQAPSALAQWPVQLALLNPRAPYFADADLLIAADCVPCAHGGFHERFLRGRTLVLFCPKLDDRLDAYIEKLAEVFRANRIKSATTVHMEVPCCSGLVAVTKEAIRRSGRDVPHTDVTVTIEGDVRE